jgi:hypothetical protein
VRATIALGWLLLGAQCTAGPGVELAVAGQRIVVTAGKEPFAEYRADGARGPCVWPLCAPGGQTVTRAFPFAEVAGEPHDHPHHTSLWFAHGAVNGVDYWQGDGHVVAVGEPAVDAAAGTIRQACEWRDGKGTVVAREQREVRFAAGADARTVDVLVAVAGAAGQLRFGDTKEGTMALRLRAEFALDGAGGAGSLANSEGQLATKGDSGAPVWGQRARWVAYTASLDGVPHTVAMFDHPENHGHPTTWHARGYALCAANPFGLHDFTKAPVGAGDLVVVAGRELRLRYRVWLHRGACDAGTIDAAWRAFAGG